MLHTKPNQTKTRYHKLGIYGKRQKNGSDSDNCRDWKGNSGAEAPHPRVSVIQHNPLLKEVDSLVVYM